MESPHSMASNGTWKCHKAPLCFETSPLTTSQVTLRDDGSCWHNTTSPTPYLCRERLTLKAVATCASNNTFTAITDAESLTTSPSLGKIAAETKMSPSESLCVSAAYATENDTQPCGGTKATYGKAISLPPVRTSLPMFWAVTYSVPPDSPPHANTVSVTFVERLATMSFGAFV